MLHTLQSVPQAAINLRRGSSLTADITMIHCATQQDVYSDSVPSDTKWVILEPMSWLEETKLEDIKTTKPNNKSKHPPV